MESVDPVGKPTLLNTTRARRVASRRLCNFDNCCRSSDRTATAMPCIARFSLISLGVCMLERERTVRQVTLVTACLLACTQITGRSKRNVLRDKKHQRKVHSRKYSPKNPHGEKHSKPSSRD